MLVGDWKELIPPRAPFELVFLDGGEAKDEPSVVQLVEPGGLFVLDDFTPGWKGNDPRRDLWLHGGLQVVGTEILTTPEMSAIVAARVR